MFALRTIFQAPASSAPIKGVTAVIANKTNNYDQSRPLCHKSKLDAKKTYRWPYEKIAWNIFTMWADPFTARKFNENTKLVVVDGNVEAGKEAVAKRIADEFGLFYMAPDLNMDRMYINGHGFDYRSLNPQLPEKLRFCDMEMWHENPSRLSVIHLQHYVFKMRLFELYRAFRHMFNTGQGVVLTRSAYSDRVFVEAMHNVGWLPTGYLRGDGVRFYDWKLRYNSLRSFILSDVPKPHLVVYVDTPVDVCLDRIKNSPDPMTRNSKALRREFLEEIETAYKDVILPKLEYNGYVHTISGAEPYQELDFVDLVDHIESLDFEEDVQDTRFADWNNRYGLWFAQNRRRFSSSIVFKESLPLARQHFYDIAGLGDMITYADLALRYSLMAQHVDDLGFTKVYDSDPKIHGWFKSSFGWEDFDTRVEKELRADFT